VGKVVNGQFKKGWLYQDQLNPVAELDSDGNVISRFIYGTNGHVPDYIVKNDSTYRFITDHLGSVRLVVNTANGHIIQRLDYDEFGNVLVNTNEGFQPFGYAGGAFDEQTGLVRFGARDYDAGMGRWTAKDPIRFVNESTNLFEYTRNDPINCIDPSGYKDRKWPLNGRVNNHSNKNVVAVDFSDNSVIDVAPHTKTSGSDLDFVYVKGKWYKIGAFEFDISEDGSPDKRDWLFFKFREANKAEIKEINKILEKNNRDPDNTNNELDPC